MVPGLQRTTRVTSLRRLHALICVCCAAPGTQHRLGQHHRIRFSNSPLTAHSRASGNPGLFWVPAFAWTSGGASTAPPALLFAARARRSPFLLPENEGAERRKALQLRAAFLRTRRALGEGRTPPGAPLRRFRSPGPCFRDVDGGLFARPIRRLSPPSSCPVQPLKAEPRSGPGRLPRASRTCACEAQAQAPHPVPLSRTPHEAPSSGQDLGI
ncbi:MAG: hypothetical protein QOG38_1209 [Hyphomicrobiales bacterium]|jgi:hypothetical protein|nr:hypothetical protein [Hyphomicrobiales bacterium]